MTTDNLNAVADSMRLLNDAARANRISPEEAARACGILAKVMGMEVPTGGHAMTSVDIDQNGVSVR